MAFAWLSPGVWFTHGRSRCGRPLEQRRVSRSVACDRTWSGRQPLAGLVGAFWRFERACGRLGRRMPAGTQALSGAGYAILTTSTLPTRMVSGPLVSTGMPFTATWWQTFQAAVVLRNCALYGR